MPRLTLVRHGESWLTSQNRFAGWTDSPLSSTGRLEAAEAGRRLVESGLDDFDIVFSSVLKRTVVSTQIILEVIDRCWIPHMKSWKLNERHYGQLEGRNKVEVAREFGADQVRKWRRSFDSRPPAVDENDDRNPNNQNRYSKINTTKFPLTESPNDCLKRVEPFFETEIIPHLLRDENVLIVSHGTVLRNIMKYVENLSEHEMEEVEIPSGVPINYDLRRTESCSPNYLSIINKNILMEPEELKRRQDKIRNAANP